MTDLLKRYSEEPKARRIARAIERERRNRGPFTTTVELASLVEKVKGGRRHGSRRRPPATQTFQALRVEVNKELDELETLLDEAVEMLDRDGRLVVISYQSLEDRRVKQVSGSSLRARSTRSPAGRWQRPE